MKSVINNRGYALVLTIIILAVVPLLGVTLLSTIVSEIKMNRSIESAIIAKYLAESGIEHALNEIEISYNEGNYIPTYVSNNWNQSGKIYKYEASIIEFENEITIESTGFYNEKDVKTIARVNEDGEVTFINNN